MNQFKRIPANYFIFDCTGQTELYTHHQSVTRIFNRLNSLDYYLCTVHLIISHYCSEATKSPHFCYPPKKWLQMRLRHVNVLSRADLLEQFQAELAFNIDFYTV